MQFVAGEQLTVRLRVVSEIGSAAAAPVRAARVGRPARRPGALDTSRRRLGGRRASSLPLRRGRASARRGPLQAPVRARPTRRRAPVPLARRCAAASRDPAGARRGLVRLEGRWTREEIAPPSDELSNLPRLARLMELAPELQFKHYTLAEAKLPGEGCRRHRTFARTRRDLLRPRAPRLLRRAHRPGVAAALRATHWYEVHE